MGDVFFLRFLKCLILAPWGLGERADDGGRWAMPRIGGRDGYSALLSTLVHVSRDIGPWNSLSPPRPFRLAIDFAGCRFERTQIRLEKG